MSNKIVPTIYRAIIDDVIVAIKSEFDDYGVGEEVLGDLQARWESKVIASHVADFEASQPAAPQHHYPSHAPHTVQHAPAPHHPSYTQATYTPQQPLPPHIKAEPLDGRFPAMTPYALPALPGPQLNGAARAPMLPGPAGPSAYNAPPGAVANGVARPTFALQPPANASGGAAQAPPRMPQVDGPSSSASDSPSPPASQQSYAPRPGHPSLPQPAKGAGTAPADSEEINSDLDDPDTDGEDEDQEGSLAETDIVFCTYDKVARVKNKWKCVLKDGMIHVNGRDYLFAKCTCEFEW